MSNNKKSVAEAGEISTAGSGIEQVTHYDSDGGAVAVLEQWSETEWIYADTACLLFTEPENAF